MKRNLQTANFVCIFTKNQKKIMVDYTENKTKSTERNELQLFIKQLDKHVEKLDEDNRSVIIRIGNTPKLLEMSKETFYFIELILEALSKGKSAVVESPEKEINVEEASRIFFHLSPHYVEKELLDKGEITYREEGGEKLMKLGEVMRYDKKLRIQRREAQAELTKISQEMGLYDMHDNPLVKK